MDDFLFCVCWVLAGRGLCDELITNAEQSYRLWRVVLYVHENLVDKKTMLSCKAREKKIYSLPGIYRRPCFRPHCVCFDPPCSAYSHAELCISLQKTSDIYEYHIFQTSVTWNDSHGPSTESPCYISDHVFLPNSISTYFTCSSPVSIVSNEFYVLNLLKECFVRRVMWNGMNHIVIIDGW
jgi:hypothetical protein